MKYEKFYEIITKLGQNGEMLHKLYSLNVDLIEFVNPYDEIISELFREIYTDDGYDWISWFCYENDFGKKGLEAFDEYQNPICYDIKSLWEYLEKNYNEKTK